MAINRDELTKLVLGAGQQPLYSVVTPTIENAQYADVHYTWQNISREKQLSEARKLYQDAGYSITKPLKIELKYQTNELNKKVAIAIMSMWQDTLGVKLTLVGEELKVLTQDLKSANYDVGMGRWGADLIQ